MSAAGERGAEEGIERLACDLVTDEALAEADHIGIIVLTCKMSRGDVVDGGGPHTGDLVGRDRDTDPAAAHADAEFGLAAGDATANRGAVVGVVDGLGAVGSEIDHLVAARFEMHDERPFERESGVIRADRDRA